VVRLGGSCGSFGSRVGIGWDTGEAWCRSRMGTASECFVTAVQRCTGTARRAAMILTIWCKGGRDGVK